MAEITKSVIGKISGTLGNMVFRNIGGKVVVYMRPHNQKISYSEKSVTNRGKFGLTSLLAKNARLLPGIEEAWMASSEPGRSAYTKLIKLNSKADFSDRLTTSNKITPMGYSINVDSITLSGERLILNYWLSEEVKEKIFPSYNANTLLFLFEPVNPEAVTKHYFIPLTKIVNEEINNIEYEFDKTIMTLVQSFRKAIIFFALTKISDRKIFWTSNFSAEIEVL